MVNVAQGGAEGAGAGAGTAAKAASAGGVGQTWLGLGATLIQAEGLQQLGTGLGLAGPGPRAQGRVAGQRVQAAIAAPQLLTLVGRQALRGHKAFPGAHCRLEY